MNNRLAQLRQDKGLTQLQLAQSLSVSRQTIISLEKGKYDPSLPLAFRIASIFGCRIEDVFLPNGKDWRQAR